MMVFKIVRPQKFISQYYEVNYQSIVFFIFV